MSAIGSYLRLTTAELRELLDADPETVPEQLGERLEEPSESPPPDPAEARTWDVDQAWDALGYLARRAGFEIDFATGGTEFGVDFGYGLRRYLTAAEVGTLADRLDRTGFAELAGGVTEAGLSAQGVLPGGWEDGDGLKYVEEHYTDLVLFFAAAAKEGEAMVLLIS